MGAVRNIVLMIHIIAAGLWIAQEFINFVLRRLIATNRGKPAEVTLANAALVMNGTFGQTASLGILLTGIGMTLNNGWVLLGIGGFTPGWLFVKQVVYIVLTVFVMVTLRPESAKLAAAFKAATSDGSMTDEARGLVSRMWMLVTIHTLVVLVNIILAVWKPAIS
jgi:hypothetical protein